MKCILVIGGGVSGLAAARLALKRGFRARISERGMIDTARKAELAQLGIDVMDGGHQESHLEGITTVVLSPGVRPDHPLCVAARARKLPQLSEIDFALADYNGHLIVVTGTNGKSTTVSMAGHILQASGVPVSVGGNLGIPPSDMAAEGALKANLVLELSSYQLEQSEIHPAIAAAFTSFSNDHVERHGSLGAYMVAKWRIFDWVVPGGLCVLTSDVSEAARIHGMKRRSDVDWIEVPGFDLGAQPAPFVGEAGVNGRHNEINAEIAVHLASRATGNEDFRRLAKHLHDFRGLPYRCQKVGAINGHAVINDSKSTNCESTVAALAGLDVPVVLLMGGKGKGESYAPVLTRRSGIKALVCFGESGQSIANELSLTLRADGISTTTHRSMKDAVRDALGLARQFNCGILFSPGCASFDEFRNFEHRGQEFNDAISGLVDKNQAWHRDRPKG